MNNKDLNAAEVELLTEFCASEVTLGGSGQYREAGVGRFM